MQLLREISLEGVRNHKKLTIDLGEITVLIGKNGVGKTAVLEAISLLSVASSWKAERDGEIITFNEPFCRIVSGDREVVIQRKPSFKRYRVDGISKKLSDILGQIPTVLFQPDDSSLIHGSPSVRRSMLDRLLSQVIPGYAKNLQVLQKVLKQRNRLLKQIQENKAGFEELTYWNEELQRIIAAIQPERERGITALTPIIVEKFHELIPNIGSIEVLYQKSPDTEENILGFFTNHQLKEVAAGVTLYGPHREDIIFSLEGNRVDTMLSRGQTRALVLAVKLAELVYIEDQTKNKPILLLDDIFAEFDEERRKKIFSLIEQYQTIMTVTDLFGVEQTLPQKTKIISLDI